MTDAPATDVIVRKYGLLAPLDWDESCDDQFRLAHRFWNRLVEIDRAHRARYREIIGDDAEMRVAQTYIDEAVGYRDYWIAERARLRKEARNKAAGALLDARIATARAAVKRAAIEAKAVSAGARTRVAEALAQAEADRRAQVKAARQQIAAEGLWWGQYNAVAASYERARAAAIKSGAELRFHSFDGGGRIVDQIQGGCTVAEAFGGALSMFEIAPVDPAAWCSPVRGERRRLARTTLTATVWSRGRDARKRVSWPMIMHRPIPEDYRIKEVAVLCERTGAVPHGRLRDGLIPRRGPGMGWRWSCVITATREAQPVAPTHGATLVVNFGFRAQDDGIRVATAMRSDRRAPLYMLAPPQNLLNAEHLTALDARAATIRADAGRLILAADWAGAPEAVQEALISAQRSDWSARRLKYLAAAIRETGWPAEAATLIDNTIEELDRLTAWRLRTAARDGRRRTDQYRKATARWLVGVGRLVVDDLAMARHLTDEDGLVARQRVQARIASPSLLRSWMIQAAKARGIEVVLAEGRTTRHCHACDQDVELARPQDLHQVCPACSATWDQDVNACRVMLARYGASGEPEARAA